MELTKKQEEGLKIAVQRYRDKEPYTVIAGFAGTGKSTLVQYIIEALDLKSNEVIYCSYTGKACSVLTRKGCPNAITAHKLLYSFQLREDGTYIKFPLEKLENTKCKLIVVDEISMLPANMWELMLSHKRHVIALGDPFQLPPIGATQNVLDHPHIFLDEVMRQAKDSEILSFSMSLREGKAFKLYKGSELNIISYDDVDDHLLKTSDVVLVGKNETRRYYNNYIRKNIYYAPSEALMEGDKVICCKNYWDRVSAVGDICVNGTVGILNNLNYSSNTYVKNELRADFLPDWYTLEDALTKKPKVYFKQLPIDYKFLTSEEEGFTYNQLKVIPPPMRPMCFEYGYALTVHKFQGSEADNVLVFEERLSNINHYRWLYTAVTRAAKSLTLVKNMYY